MHSSQDMEATSVPINRWMDKDVIHIYNRTLLSREKEWNPAICKTWMDLEGITLSEIIQTEKDKYFMILLICGI